MADDLTNLWEAYVFEYSSSRNRPHSAIEVLQQCRDLFNEAIEKGEADSAVRMQSHARAIFSLLATELVDWIVEFPGKGVPAAENLKRNAAERDYLLTLIKDGQNCFPPTHVQEVDPVTIVLPRWLATQLNDGLQALASGEVQALVRPSIAGRHDDAWSWDQMRRRAIEHVFFLRGQHWPAEKARSKVAEMTQVSPVTLRKWERDLLKSGFTATAAEGAGRLKLKIEEDPLFGHGDGNSKDAVEAALLAELTSEPLRAFGEAYARRFGHRHNQ